MIIRSSKGSSFCTIVDIFKSEKCLQTGQNWISMKLQMKFSNAISVSHIHGHIVRKASLVKKRVFMLSQESKFHDNKEYTMTDFHTKIQM